MESGPSTADAASITTIGRDALDFEPRRLVMRPASLGAFGRVNRHAAGRVESQRFGSLSRRSWAEYAALRDDLLDAV